MKPYKANSSTIEAKAVPVPMTILTMGTQRFGAGGRTVSSARKQVMEEIEKKVQYTDAYFEKIKDEIIKLAERYMGEVLHGIRSGYGPFFEDNDDDGHTLTWMKFGTSTLDEALKKYNVARKEYRKANKGKDDGGNEGDLAKKESGDTDRKQMLRNMFGNMKRFVEGPVPYAARRGMAYRSLGHKFVGAIHIQRSGGSGAEHRGDTISRMFRIEFDPERKVHRLMLDDPNAAKVMKWLEKGTSGGPGNKIMIGRGNFKRRFGAEVRSSFVDRVRTHLTHNYVMTNKGFNLGK